jgi:hypothetical protein
LFAIGTRRPFSKLRTALMDTFARFANPSWLQSTDDEAHARFEAIRFADNGCAAFCPRCDCTAVYAYAVRRIWKCKACSYQFSVTSGTIFASRKPAPTRPSPSSPVSAGPCLGSTTTSAAGLGAVAYQQRARQGTRLAAEQAVRPMRVALAEQRQRGVLAQQLDILAQAAAAATCRSRCMRPTQPLSGDRMVGRQ